MDFVKFDDALSRLGITAERLNQLREDGQLRAYRDGASWKFRADEVEKYASEGVPDPPPPSDIGLPRLDELVDARELGDLADLEDDDLKLVDEDQSELEVDLADLDDTVTAGGDDAKGNVLVDSQLESSSDPSDSILLTDESLGDSAPSAPSTIIGKKDLASKDADLELVTDDDLAPSSDVKLIAGASNVLTPGAAGSGVLDDLGPDSGNLAAFENLEELEIDLAAESSRVLNPAEAAELREKVKASKQPKAVDTDLELADLHLPADEEGTDPVPEALVAEGSAIKSKPGDAPPSDLELATDEDDFVLADAGGSDDITLDSADSGINLVSPSDSGLALDSIPLEAGGSAILDSLSGIGLDKPKGMPAKAKKSGPDSELSLVAGDSDVGAASGLQTDDDFRLTPMGDADDEGDSSSQVIAVDEGLGDLGADEGLLGEEVFAEESGEGVALAEDFQEAGMGEFGAAPAYAGAAARTEGDYSPGNILLLSSVVILLLMTIIVGMDLVRNVSSWNENLSLNDSLLEAILGLFGLR